MAKQQQIFFSREEDGKGMMLGKEQKNEVLQFLWLSKCSNHLALSVAQLHSTSLILPMAPSCSPYHCFCLWILIMLQLLQVTTCHQHNAFNAARIQRTLWTVQPSSGFLARPRNAIGVSTGLNKGSNFLPCEHSTSVTGGHSMKEDTSASEINNPLLQDKGRQIFRQSTR